jgi:dimethylglycine dehydrogenase
VTDDYGVLVLAGPRSRDVLGKLTNADLGNAAFPWLTAQAIDVAGIPTRALRISYVGELGWELHHPVHRMLELYEALVEAGREYRIADFGTYAVNSMRMEKAYKAWGAELTTEVGLMEADMERFGDLAKGDFVGRAALARCKESGIDLKLVYCEVEALDADAMGNEPVYRDDRIIGITTSGAYGHAVGRSLAFAYVEPAYAAPGSELEILLLGERRPARVLPAPAYDPVNARPRA